MTVNTKKVDERRELHFDSFDEILADAEALTNGDTRTVGNWTVGQIFSHLALTMHSSIDGTEMKFPWIMKKLVPLFMKKEKMLNGSLPPGFKIPKKGAAQFSPAADVTTEEGLQALRDAIERCRSEGSRAEHPVFGKLTAEEWDTFHFRHAELHMSFALPA